VSGDSDPVEERVRSYLKARADVSVPRGILSSALAKRDDNVGSHRFWRFSAGVGLASAATLLIVVALALGPFAGPPPGPAHSSNPSAVAIGSPASPSASPTTTSAATPSADFPATVLGMPVVSVSEAVDLLSSGRLDGRAVAVAGYWSAFQPPCPPPNRPFGALEGFCHFIAFTSQKLESVTCCTFNFPAGVSSLAPFPVEETSGYEALQPGGSTPLESGGSTPLVLIGHAGDPRLWFCPPESRESCRRAFVLDRVAWADGHELPVELAGWRGTPRELAADDLATILPPGSQMLSAVVVPLGDAATIDPRLRSAGNNSSFWVVHAIGPQAAASNSEPTRSVDVYVIHDLTRQLLSTTNLAMDAGYQPARFSVDVRVAGLGMDGDYAAMYSVGLPGGPTFERRIGGSMSHARPWITFGPDYPDILEPGTYTVRAWITGVPTPGLHECSTQVVLNSLDDVAIEASFARDGICTWGPPVDRPFD
jgi:hypothetical protein